MIPPHLQSKPLVADEWMKVEKKNKPGTERERKRALTFPSIPSTPAVPASQPASCSLPNELFTSAALDQNLTSNSKKCLASILPET